MIVGLALAPKSPTTATIIGGSPTVSPVMLFPAAPKSRKIVTASYIHNSVYLDAMLDSFSELLLAGMPVVTSTPLKQCQAMRCGGQMNSCSWLGQSSACAGYVSSLYVSLNAASCSYESSNF